MAGRHATGCNVLVAFDRMHQDCAQESAQTSCGQKLPASALDPQTPYPAVIIRMTSLYMVIAEQNC